jgi:hypothetical protein
VIGRKETSGLEMERGKNWPELVAAMT